MKAVISDGWKLSLEAESDKDMDFLRTMGRCVSLIPTGDFTADTDFNVTKVTLRKCWPEVD